MDNDQVIKFFRWLDKQLTPRNMKYSQLARKAGLSHSAFSKAKSGALPKWEACMAIAIALEVDPIEVFRAASLLPDLPPADSDFEQFRHQFYRFSQDKRDLVMRVLKALFEED